MSHFLTTALVVVLCGCLAWGGMCVFDGLYDTVFPVSDETPHYRLNLSRLTDGRIVVTADTTWIDSDTMTSCEDMFVDGKQLVYVCLREAPVHSVNDSDKSAAKWCVTVLNNEGDPPVDEIRQGTPDSYVTLWKAGEPIPVASEDMEAYFALEAEYAVWWDSRPTAENGAKTIVDSIENAVWLSRLEGAQLAVPEWR